MTLLYILGFALVMAVFVWSGKGVSALNALERGDHGPFKVSRTSSSDDSYLALDADGKKLALVNNRVPEFNGQEEVTGYKNMTVVFSISDVDTVQVVLDGTVALVHFRFVKPVPSWNIRKELVYASGAGIRKFFEKYVPDIKVGYYVKNRYGGVEPW